MSIIKKPTPYRSTFGNKWAVRHSVPYGLGIVVAAAVTIVAFIAVIKSNDGGIQYTAETEQLVSLVTVIDGDTIDLNGNRVRLYGIDAPESSQPCSRNGVAYNCGLAATNQLKFILSGERLQCEKKSSDRWAREISICRIGTTDVGKQMVRQGWAVAYREYSTAYVEDEMFARENSLGIWAKEFELPKDWRNRGAN